MWHGHSVSVILPTYNEKDSIRQVVLDIQSTGVVDEVIVVNNNAVAGTSEAVADTGAREILESRQGYGWSIRRGLAESSADYLIVCEPDGTFFAGDVFKLLSYAEDFDVVYGSRTSQQLIWSGANMGIFLRWGNWCVAKYMQFLYNATSLTDVGCTMRLIRRQVAATSAAGLQDWRQRVRPRDDDRKPVSRFSDHSDPGELRSSRGHVIRDWRPGQGVLPRPSHDQADHDQPVEARTVQRATRAASGS